MFRVRLQILKHLVLIAFAISLVANIALSDDVIDWRVVPAVLLGWYIADASSGIVHMYMDYKPVPTGRGLAEIFFYGGSRTSDDYLNLRKSAMSRIGPFYRLVYDFKNHHPRPDALGRRSFVDLIWSTVTFGALPLSLILILAETTWSVPLWWVSGAVVMLVGSALAQYFHSSLHRRDVPFAIHALRSLGLLMTPSAHALHHATLKRDFATNCGWSNPLLNPVFRHLYRRGILSDAGLEPG
ncbi:hypothetical protein BH09PSE3_BH09PSE3_28200 [soil metagenome]